MHKKKSYEPMICFQIPQFDVQEPFMNDIFHALIKPSKVNPSEPILQHFDI